MCLVTCKSAKKWYLIRMCISWLCPFKEDKKGCARRCYYTHQQTLPFQTPYRLERNCFTRPFNHKIVDLRMILTKTRLQVNGLVKRRKTHQEDWREKKFLVQVSLNGHWHGEWNYMLSEITKFNLWKLLCFQPKQCPLRKVNTKQNSTYSAGLKKLQPDCSFIQFSISGHKFL